MFRQQSDLWHKPVEVRNDPNHRNHWRMTGDILSGSGMKFSLIHLSGQHRGKTLYFDCTRLSLGSGHNNDLVFPADGHQPVVPKQVELYEANCQIHLRNVDHHVSTLVNHNPLVEATLQDQDLL